MATFNVENLDAERRRRPSSTTLADLIVTNLRRAGPGVAGGDPGQQRPDERRRRRRLADPGRSSSTRSPRAGGPTYEFRQIDPVDNQDGGEPGGNIRVGFLFRTDRGLAFVDRPGGGRDDGRLPCVDGAAGPQLTVSPGRIDPTNPALTNSRKPLVGEFTYNGADGCSSIGNHFNSKGGDQPLFGRFQPPTRGSEVQRNQQARLVERLRRRDPGRSTPRPTSSCCGDLNDFEFSRRGPACSTAAGR